MIAAWGFCVCTRSGNRNVFRNGLIRGRTSAVILYILRYVHKIRDDGPLIGLLAIAEAYGIFRFVPQIKAHERIGVVSGKDGVYQAFRAEAGSDSLEAQRQQRSHIVGYGADDWRGYACLTEQAVPDPPVDVIFGANDERTGSQPGKIALPELLRGAFVRVGSLFGIYG